jgi:DNA-binding IclR family transcriptional regulator
MEKTEQQSGWDRFQALLEALQPGDEIHVAAAARDTGLPPHTCEHVLEALTRVDLFTRLGDHAFVRRRLFQMIEQLES